MLEEPLSTRVCVSRDEGMMEKMTHLSAMREHKVQLKKYEEADAINNQINDELEQYKQIQHKHEKKRQMREMDRLSHSRAAAIQRSSQHSKQTQNDVRQVWDQRFLQLEQRQNKDLQAFDQFMSHKQSRKRLVFSSHTRDLQLAEEKLSANHCYTESRMCRNKVTVLEQKEREKMARTLEEQMAAAQDRLRQKHETERNFAEVQMRNELSALARQATNEQRIVGLRFENIKRDMSHAHKQEFNSRPGMAVYVQPHFIKLKSKRNTATARGTQLSIMQTGGRSKIPSLVSLYASELNLHAQPPLPSTKLPSPWRARNSSTDSVVS